MTLLCVRCLEVDVRGNFCPVCGRSLLVSPLVPTRKELEQSISEVTALLPRLRRMRLSLEPATRHGERATSELALRRQSHLSRIKRRLEAHLRWARKRLSEHVDS